MRPGLILLGLMVVWGAAPVAAQTPPPPKPQPTVQPDQGVPAKCARLIKATDREKCLKSLPH
jgi:hypothetical protein